MKNFKRGQFLVVKQDFHYLSGCFGSKLVKKNLLVKVKEHNEHEFTVESGTLNHPVGNGRIDKFRTLLPKERFTAGSQWKKDNTFRESYVK